MWGCEKVVFDDDAVPPVSDDTTSNLPEYLIATNDTARFYLSGTELRGITLSECPTPSALITDSHYRLPTRLEVHTVLRNADIPTGYWMSNQRILCYDTLADNGIKVGSTMFGTDAYYTFIPHGNVTKAGFQTEYCILPIRTERTGNTGSSVIIGINDMWE